MAHPEGRVFIDKAEAQEAAERYAKMEAELQALRQRNEEIMCDLQEARNAAATGTCMCRPKIQGSDAGIC